MIEYDVIVKIKAKYDNDPFSIAKSDEEYATGLAQMICDEVTTAGGVAEYEILKAHVHEE